MASSMVVPALLALAALSETVSAIRNIATPPVIIPLSFAYNTTFSQQSPGRFLAAVSLGTPEQNLSLALDLSRPDIEIRHEAGVLPGDERFWSLLFKNASSDSFAWEVPANDLNGWLGAGPTDNLTIGSLAKFRTGWNRWGHTESVNLSPLQREEMLAYGMSGLLGLHGPACAVDGGSWFTSLVATGGAPFRTWGVYFNGGFATPAGNDVPTNIDGDSPDFTGMLFLGGYQPSKFSGALTIVGNITYNNGASVQLTSTSLPRDPHLLRIDSVAINNQRTVVPPRGESWFIIKPESIFSNFTTRAQAASFATALGAASTSIGNGRTVFTFPNCSDPNPTANVEVLFPSFPAGSSAPRQRIAMTPASLKVQLNGTCYLSFQEPWDIISPTDQAEQITAPTRGTLGLSFLRNAYLHTDYDAGAYYLAPRNTAALANLPNPLAVYASPNPPTFVLDQCWNREDTPTGVIQGEYQDSWYSFSPAFIEYYTPIIGPPWVYRIANQAPSATTTLLALFVVPLGVVFCLVLAWVNKKVGHVVVGQPPVGEKPALKGKI